MSTACFGVPFWLGCFIYLLVPALYIYFAFCDIFFVFFVPAVGQSLYSYTGPICWNITLFEIQGTKLAYSFITDRIGIPVLIVYSTS